MKYAYHTTHQMTYTELDQHERLSPVFAIALTQDVTTRYYETIHSDNYYLRFHYGAVWVITKTRLKMFRYPTWQDTLEIDSYTTKVSAVRACLETAFRDQQGKLMFLAQQEFCPIDMDKRCIRRISTIGYPEDMETTPAILTDDFTRLHRAFAPEEAIGSRKVLYTDIDFSRHTNNVYYVKYLLDTEPTSFWEPRFLEEIEIHYLHESVEGSELKIFRAEEPSQEGTSCLEFLIQTGEGKETRDITRARFLYHENI